MTHGSLFSGIGGFDLAAEWMGWDNLFHCEWNEFGQKVLNHYWPNAESFTDITKTDFKSYANRIDILSGGFPCQPYSTAGKRLGKEDDRHLWPEVVRAIREISPRWVVGENVRGLTNWNGGLVFDEVQADLETEGYEVLPFLLPACAINAPHRRDRIWFIARYSKSNGKAEIEEISSKGIRGKEGADTFRIDRVGRVNDNIRNANNSSGQWFETTAYSGSNGQQRSNKSAKIDNRGIQKGLDEGHEFNSLHGARDASNTSKQGFQIRRGTQMGGYGKKQEFKRFDSKSNWNNFPTQSPVRFRNDGFPTGMDNATISYAKWCQESIKAAGNAIVPQVALEIFKAIEAYENR